MKLKSFALSALLASQLSSAEETQKLDDVNIKEKPIENKLLEKPLSEPVGLEIATSKITRKDIEKRNARTLTDILDTAPGALTETRGRKVKQFTSFRGQMYPYPDYAINGIWQREFDEMAYVIPAEMIETIDIMRSSGALMMGMSDIAGVINVKTRRFEEQTTILGAEYGTHNSQKMSVTHGDSFQNGWYTLGLSRWRTDGPSNNNAGEEMNSFFLNTGYTMDKLTLELNAFYIDGERELRKGDANSKGSLQQRTERYDPSTNMSLSLKTTYKHNRELTTEFDTYVSHRRAEYIREDWKPTTFFEEDYEYGVSLAQARALSENNTLRYGVHFNHWVSPNGKRYYTNNRMDQDTYAFSIVDEHKFDKLTLDAGFRYQRTYDRDNSGHGFDKNGNNPSYSDPIESEWRDPELRWSLGGKYQLNQIAALYSNFTFGILDAPNGATTVDFQTPDTETRYMVDFGVQFSDADYGFIKTGVFYTYRDNAITLSGTTAIDPITGEEYDLYQNRDITQYGFEIEARSTKIFNYYELFASATLMDSEADSGNGDEDYVEVPDFIFTTGVYADFGRWDANFLAKYVSDYKNNRFSNDGSFKNLGDFWDISLNIGYKIGESTRIYCSLENILDDEYSTVVGYPDYGFQGYVGLTHEF